MKKAVLCGLCFGESFPLSSRKFQEAPAWELKCPQLQAVESTQRILGTVHLRGNVRSHGLSQEKAWLTRKPPSLGRRHGGSGVDARSAAYFLVGIGQVCQPP